MLIREKDKPMTNNLRAVILPSALAALLLATTLQVDAQTGMKEEFTAFAVNMDRGMSGMVDIVVEKWSPPGDREALLKVFVEKGANLKAQEALLRELQKRPRLGYIKLPNTLGWDLHYAVQHPLDEGGRRVVLVTDRPIGFREAANNNRSMDYPFTMIEIRFDKAGVGVGKLSTGTQIKKSKDGTQLELETWGTEPTRLTEVRAKALKR